MLPSPPSSLIPPQSSDEPGQQCLPPSVKASAWKPVLSQLRPASSPPAETSMPEGIEKPAQESRFPCPKPPNEGSGPDGIGFIASASGHRLPPPLPARCALSRKADGSPSSRPLQSGQVRPKCFAQFTLMQQMPRERIDTVMLEILKAI